MRRFTIGVLALMLAAGVGCSSDSEASNSATSEQDKADEVAEQVSQIQNCADLPEPVDDTVLQLGCMEDGAVVFGASIDCEDGSRLIIAGDHRAGIEGGEWVEVDPSSGEVWNLCP